MVRLSKIYTKTGDKGSTRLVGGQKVPKDSLRIASYGTVDELNACLGLVRVAMRASDADPAARADIEAFLRRVQNELFDLGSDLATRMEDRWPGQPLVDMDDVTELERRMDAWNDELAPLDSFVLPGGNEVAARLHLARTVCRRAERDIVALSREEPLGEPVIPYINRLSDALFVLSRWVTHRMGAEEFLWEKP
ncbi:MAG: ATP--cob(I)alamin adenosyltransferase [Myxococcales bacterium]